MRKEETRKISFIIGLIILIFSIFYAFLGKNHWYFPAVIGAWLFFDYLSSIKNKKTTFSLILNKKWRKFFQIYFLLLFLGISIEIIGQYFFKWWFYPKLPKFIMIIIIPIFYPFILMSFRDMYVIIKAKFKNITVSITLTSILGIIIWEIPNLFSRDWIYTIHFFPELFGINLLIILLWPLLIILPLEIYNKIIFYS